MSSEKITFLLNWHATPYHLPLFRAQQKGYFADEGIKVAILEPNDPSDVTEVIGTGHADMGFKAMIHTLAAKANGYPVTSIGTVMDEPFTGLIYLKGSGITEDFTSIKGKRGGYVGHFGKIQLDAIAEHFGMKASDYEAVRVGMDATEAIKTGFVDGAIGLENVQMVELEEWCKEVGRPTTDVQMLRIDELADLGCCCFCSILYIANDDFLAREPEKAMAFMRAVKRASDDLQRDPKGAWADYKKFKKTMDTPVNEKIFERSFVYMSKDCANVERDLKKVTAYVKRLGLVEPDFEANATNKFLSWKPDAETEDPLAKQKDIARYQGEVADAGGVLSAAPPAPIAV